MYMETRKTSDDIPRENLTAIRRANDIRSNRQIERACGVPDRMIERILNGDSNPTIDIIDKLAAAFRMTGWQLLVDGAARGTMNHRAVAVIQNYMAADEDGRDYIARVAEKESGYHS